MKKMIFYIVFLFPIFAVSQSLNDYRTVAAEEGDWSTVALWERYNGSSWVAATAYPNNFTTIVLIENVDFGVSIDVDITIFSGGSIEIDDASSELFIGSGATLTNDDSGNFLGEDVMTVESGGTYNHNVNGGEIPVVASWESGSTLQISGMTTTIPTNFNQSFKIIDINSSGLTSNISMHGTSFNSIKITNTGSKSVIIDETETWSQNITIESNGVLTIQDDGKLTATGTITNNGTASNFIIEASASSSGSFIYNGTAISGTYKQYIPSGVWHLLGIPVSKGTGATLAAFNPATGDGFMRAYETVNSDWGAYMTTESDQLNVGQGYEYWCTVNHTASVTGNFNTGVQSLSLVSTGDGMNLFANPYPCFIDWEAVGDNTNTLTGTIWYYDNYNSGLTNNGYRGYSANTNTSINGGTQYIPPFQGFFVKHSTGSNIGFANDDKVHASGVFYKNETDDEGIYDRVRLEIRQNDTLREETIIVFVEDATNEYDSFYDTKLPANNYIVAPQISTKIGEENFVINAIGSYPAVVPLELEIIDAGSIELTVTEMSDMQETTGILLEDREENIFYILDDNFQGFSFDVEEGILSDRFFVHYGINVGTDDIEQDNLTIYSNRNRIYIDNKNSESFDVQVVNMMGQMVYEGQMSNGGVQSITVNEPSAYYVVRVISEHQTFTKNLFIAN